MQPGKQRPQSVRVNATVTHDGRIEPREIDFSEVTKTRELMTGAGLRQLVLDLRGGDRVVLVGDEADKFARASGGAASERVIAAGLTPEQRRFLQAVFDHFHAEAQWPTYWGIGRRLVRELDVETVARSLPPGFVNADSAWEAKYQRGEWASPVTLFLPAIQQCLGAEGELAAFLSALQLCLERYTDPDLDTPEISGTDLRGQLRLDEAMARKTALLLRQEPHILASGGGDPGAPTWRFAISADIGRYRGTGTIAEYMARRPLLPTPTQMQLGATSEPLTTLGQRALPRSSQSAETEKPLIDERLLEATLAAVADLWPGADGALASEAVRDRLLAAGQRPPPGALEAIFGDLWARDLLRGPSHLDRDAVRAHGARTITWVAPRLLDNAEPRGLPEPTGDIARVGEAGEAPTDQTRPRQRAVPKKRAYRLEPQPLDTGGQAEVYVATHKETGDQVAFKRVRDRDAESLARMRREIEAQRALAHPHIMPVLDQADDFSWYTMPLADAVLDRLPLPIADDELATIIEQCAEGLAAAHTAGYLHRDVTPRNVMRLAADGESRWVLADWGAVRRPRGMTTTIRTRAGELFGTEGFAAPEAWSDAHAMDGRADVYSLGRVVAWAATGEAPRPNVPLVPTGRWRRFVEATTAEVPDDRPAGMGEVRALLRRATAGMAGEHAAASPRPGGRIAYVGQGQQIHILDLDTGDDATFLTAGRPYSPRWSPDGRQLVYGEELSPSPRRSQIAILDPATGRTRVLVRPEVRFGDALHPPADYFNYHAMCWTPVGEAIVYKKASGARMHNAYMRVPAAGGPPEELQSGTSGFFLSTSDFDLSPTDGRMAITDNGLDADMGSGRLAVSNLDGSGLRVVRPFGGSYYAGPVWTADGREIAVVQGVGDPVTWMLTLIDPDAETQRVLGPVAQGTGYAFAPDGRWIVLADGDTGELLLARIDSFAERRSLGRGSLPTWGRGVGL